MRCCPALSSRRAAATSTPLGYYPPDDSGDPSGPADGEARLRDVPAHGCIWTRRCRGRLASAGGRRLAGGRDPSTSAQDGCSSRLALAARGCTGTCGVREIFVSKALPHRTLTTGALRHRVRLCARRAGYVAAQIGSHVFRHSHATRQVDAGAPAKTVSDILGHRRPSSTSVYVRVAFGRLRTVALPVPR
jgi:hypothetical protein